MRELLDVIEQEDTEAKEIKHFENKTLNAAWEEVFRIKTPSISHKKAEVMNASFLVCSEWESHTLGYDTFIRGVK